MANSEEQESETSELVKPLREIPFRLKFDDEDFVKRAYNVEPFAAFFLSNQCSEKFAKIAKKMLLHPLIYQRYVNMKEAENKATTEVARSYSRDVPESIMNPDIPISSEYLSSISPSAPTDEFIEYSTIDFETKISPDCFDFEDESFFVDNFLRLLSEDEELFVFMVIFLSDMEPAEATQLKHQCEKGEKLEKEMETDLERQEKITQKEAVEAGNPIPIAKAAADPPPPPVVKTYASALAETYAPPEAKTYASAVATKPSSSSKKISEFENAHNYFTHFPKLPEPNRN